MPYTINVFGFPVVINKPCPQTNVEKILREKGLFNGKNLRGLGLRKISKDTGICRNSLSRHIHKKSVLKTEAIEKLATYLEIEPSQLVDAN